MKSIFVVLVIILFAIPAYAQFDVLMAAQEYEGWQEPIQDGLVAFSEINSVDWWNMHTSGTPVLSDIQSYDCVITWNMYAYSDPVGWGDTLADYVDGGGDVIIAPHAYGAVCLEGRIMTSGYSPFSPAIEVGIYTIDSWELGSPDMPGHPFLEDVSSLACGWRYEVGLNSWGNLVTHYSGDNEEAIAYNDNYTVTSINVYPRQDGPPNDWTGDYPQVMRNVVVEMCSTSGIESASIGEIKAIFK